MRYMMLGKILNFVTQEVKEKKQQEDAVCRGLYSPLNTAKSASGARPCSPVICGDIGKQARLNTPESGSER